MGVIYPRHLPHNEVPPPVYVHQITADRTVYDLASAGNGRLRLPQLLRDLTIDYTALSLVAPEKVLFRYMLEGFDREWQQAGNRRQAFYTNLPPRHYLSTRKTSGEADFGRSSVVQGGSKTETVRKSCVTRCLFVTRAGLHKTQSLLLWFR